MSTPKYSKLECERRFLVRSPAPIDLSKLNWVEIQDRYLDGTRMRLRSVREADGTSLFKLCKKYPSDDPYAGAIVNTYLSAAEYQLFDSLPGAIVSKRRYRLASSYVPFSVDAFTGHLDGLILCEVEMPTREAVCAVEPPEWVTREVTEDEFFRGGSLARITASQLLAKLS